MAQTFEIGTRVRAMIGMFEGKEGKVNAIANDVKFCIGVSIPGETFFTIWFEPNALESIE